MKWVLQSLRWPAWSSRMRLRVSLRFWQLLMFSLVNLRILKQTLVYSFLSILRRYPSAFTTCFSISFSSTVEYCGNVFAKEGVSNDSSSQILEASSSTVTSRRLQLRELSCSLVFSMKFQRQAAAIMGISRSILAVRTMFLMKLETLSMVGLKQSMAVGAGSSKILSGCAIPKSTDSPPRKEDSIILSPSTNSLCSEVLRSSSSSSSPSEQASSSHTSSSSTSSLYSGCRKLSFRISPTSSSMSSISCSLPSFSAPCSCVCGSPAATILLATSPEKAQTSSSTSMLAMVEVMSAPSKERLSALTLSISRLISRTFLVDMEGVLCTPLRRRTRDSRLVVVSPFLTVGLVESVFFLKSRLRSRTEEEYLVLAYLVSLGGKEVFLSDCRDPTVFFLGSDCGVYSFSTRSSCRSQSASFLASTFSLAGSFPSSTDCCSSSSGGRQQELLARVSMILSSLTVCPGSILSSSQSLRLSSSLMSASLPRLMPQPRWMKPRVYCWSPAVRRSLYAGMESQLFFSQRSSSSCASAATLLLASFDCGLIDDRIVVFACRILLWCAFSFSPSSNLRIIQITPTPTPTPQHTQAPPPTLHSNASHPHTTPHTHTAATPHPHTHTAATHTTATTGTPAHHATTIALVRLASSFCCCLLLMPINGRRRRLHQNYYVNGARIGESSQEGQRVIPIPLLHPLGEEDQQSRDGAHLLRGPPLREVLPGHRHAQARQLCPPLRPHPPPPLRGRRRKGHLRQAHLAGRARGHPRQAQAGARGGDLGTREGSQPQAQRRLPSPHRGGEGGRVARHMLVLRPCHCQQQGHPRSECLICPAIYAHSRPVNSPALLPSAISLQPQQTAINHDAVEIGSNMRWWYRIKYGDGGIGSNIIDVDLLLFLLLEVEVGGVVVGV